MLPQHSHKTKHRRNVSLCEMWFTAEMKLLYISTVQCAATHWTTDLLHQLFTFSFLVKVFFVNVWQLLNDCKNTFHIWIQHQHTVRNVCLLVCIFYYADCTHCVLFTCDTKPLIQVAIWAILCGKMKSGNHGNAFGFWWWGCFFK